MQQEIFRDYISELIKWNERMNLISKHDYDILWPRHFANSLLLVPYLSKEEQILDIGSGAGFPGLVLAYMGYRNVILCEKSPKKCMFLRYMSNKIKYSPTVINDRIENICHIRCDTVVARAFAPLYKILTLNIKCSRWILLKGKNIYTEIEEARQKIPDIYHYQVIDHADGVILNVYKY